ncbi:MAG: hypothetical protein WCE90_03930 [Candidatus Zixiibacteriota bacterium]
MEKGKRAREGKMKGGKRGMFLLPSLIFLFSSALGAWFGQETCSSHYAVGTGYADAQRFQAPEDGNSSYLEILTSGETGAGAFRMAVYDDSSGHPNHKLWEGTSLSYAAGQWCGEDVTTISISKDSYYWFAFKTNASEDMCYSGASPANSHEWKSGQTYSNSFPNPWGGYTGHNANRYTMRMYYSTPGGSKGIIEIDPGIIEGGIER